MISQQLKEEIIIPVLRKLESKLLNIQCTDAAVNLLLGTAAQESVLGKYVRQLGFNHYDNRGGLGIYQMELDTHNDIWNNFIMFKSAYIVAVQSFKMDMFSAKEELIINLAYATVMARMHYFRAPEPLPDAKDVDGLAHYWKKYYNTEKGKGTVTEFIDNYKSFVLYAND